MSYRFDPFCSQVTLLVEKDIFVRTVNALRMEKYCAQSIRKAKNDRIDAFRIASYGLTYWNELIPVKPAENVYKELKLLARQYYQTISMLIKAKINLSNLIDQVMPDIDKILSNNVSHNKLTDFVARYWHYEHILKMGKKTRILYARTFGKRDPCRSSKRYPCSSVLQCYQDRCYGSCTGGSSN
ncbi:MAG: transposase [Clostridia bacterium]|nr:transposase [Clostridia bacterium]